VYFLYVLQKVGNYTNIYNKTCILFLYSFLFDAICAVFVSVVILQLVTIKSCLWHEICISL